MADGAYSMMPAAKVEVAANEKTKLRTEHYKLLLRQHSLLVLTLVFVTRTFVAFCKGTNTCLCWSGTSLSARRRYCSFRSSPLWPVRRRPPPPWIRRRRLPPPWTKMRKEQSAAAEHAEAMVAEEAEAASTVAEEPQFATTKEAQRRNPW